VLDALKFMYENGFLLLDIPLHSLRRIYNVIRRLPPWLLATLFRTPYERPNSTEGQAALTRTFFDQPQADHRNELSPSAHANMAYSSSRRSEIVRDID